MWRHQIKKKLFGILRIWYLIFNFGIFFTKFKIWYFPVLVFSGSARKINNIFFFLDASGGLFTWPIQDDRTNMTEIGENDRKIDNDEC